MKAHYLKIIILLLLMMCNVSFKSQAKSEDARLSNIWVLHKIDWATYTFFFKREKNFKENKLAFQFKKNGKIIAKTTPVQCMVGETGIKLKKYKGNWEKVSDSTINLKFPFTNGIRGYHIIEKITEDELVLRKNIKIFSK